jgi:hypothetical protein
MCMGTFCCLTHLVTDELWIWKPLELQTVPTCMRVMCGKRIHRIHAQYLLDARYNAFRVQNVCDCVPKTCKCMCHMCAHINIPAKHSARTTNLRVDNFVPTSPTSIPPRFQAFPLCIYVRNSVQWGRSGTEAILSWRELFKLARFRVVPKNSRTVLYHTCVVCATMHEMHFFACETLRPRVTHVQFARETHAHYTLRLTGTIVVTLE